MGYLAFPMGHCEILLGFLLLLQRSSCQYYLEEDKPCAVFSSGIKFIGEQFKLGDGSKSINLAEDYPAPYSSGWNTSGLITVADGYKLEVCNETYFQGTCQTLANGSYHLTSVLNISTNSSASCGCQKVCKCSDIFMKKTSCARAYLQGGCRTCNPTYIDMEGSRDHFPEDFIGKVEALRLRKGCHLTLYSDEDFEGKNETIYQEIVEDFSGEFRSYECECDDDSQLVPRVKPIRPSSYPPLIDIPETQNDVMRMMMIDQNSTNHPGLRAAQMSLKNGRSSKNAYILVLGTTGSGKGSAIDLLFDNPITQNIRGCGVSAIAEYIIPVPVDEIGIRNSELRIIEVPGLGDGRGSEHDARILATLDSYLSNHEDLKDKLPNVVLIFHKFNDNRFNGEGSFFVKMLRAFGSFRERIADSNYSNVIFVLSHFGSETKANQRRPERKLAQFKTIIENYSSFPNPISLAVAENKGKDQELPKLNGYFRLPNNEYYPKNLFEKMELAVDRGGDRIGLAVFRSAFRDSDYLNVTSVIERRLESNSSTIAHYLPFFMSIDYATVNTEVSQLLQETWDEKLNASLKRQFPGSPHILRKEFIERNITFVDDLPKTTTAILELFKSLKLSDDGMRELLKLAFNLEAPQFPHSTVAGFGYDLQKDGYLSTSPLQIENQQVSGIGFLTPKILKLSLEPSMKHNFHLFDYLDQYIPHRLRSLGIAEGNQNISHESFESVVVKPGHNIKSMSSFNENGCHLSTMVEFRLFKFFLTDKPELGPKFKNAVKSLPIYNGCDPENVEEWTRFFANYGTHVVNSVHGGGQVEVKLDSDKPCDSQMAEALFDLTKFMNELSYNLAVADEEDDSERDAPSPPGTNEVVIEKMKRELSERAVHSTISAESGTSHVAPEENEGDAGEATSGNVTKLPPPIISDKVNHSIIFTGGDSAYHVSNFVNLSVGKVSKILANWKKSLQFHPAILTTEMELQPISKFARRIGRNYSAEIETAAQIKHKYICKGYGPRNTAYYEATTAREGTSYMNENLKRQAQFNQQFSEMIDQLKNVEAVKAKTEEDLESARINRDGERANVRKNFLDYYMLDMCGWIRTGKYGEKMKIDEKYLAEKAKLEKVQDAHAKLAQRLIRKAADEWNAPKD